MKKATIGYAFTGSFCTFEKSIAQMEMLAEDYEILPIMSFNAYSVSTRFGKAEDIVDRIEAIAQKSVIHTLAAAEPIGPKKMCELMIVAPCTGNTLAKLSGGITDTPVTMAVKSHLRCLRPVLLAAATNDALGASAQNIGRLLNTKNIYFVPMSQDDPVSKPNSLVAHFDLMRESAENAMKGIQTQPVLR